MLQEQLDKNKLLLQEERDLNITLQADFTKLLTQNNDQVNYLKNVVLNMYMNRRKK